MMPSLLPSKSADLISELLLGMRLFGLQYRRIEIRRASGVGFTNAMGRAQFHFVGRGPVWLRSPSRSIHALNTGDAILIPHGGPHAMLHSPDTPAYDVTNFNATSSNNYTSQQVEDIDTPVIFSCCMEFDLGGMQPLIAAMPALLFASALQDTSPEIEPILDAMERESTTRRAGHEGILVRLAEVVAALVVRGWVAGGCGNASGWIAALQDPRLSKAIVMMHKEPGKSWTVAELAKEAGNSRSVFAQRFLLATGVSPLRYLTDLRMRLATHSLSREHQPVEVVASRLGYGSLAAFSRAFKRSTGTSPGAVRAQASITLGKFPEVTLSAARAKHY
jgi:AraC-like DNA-binding protein